MGHAQYPSYLSVIKLKPAAFLSGSPARNFVSGILVSPFEIFRHSIKNSDNNSKDDSVENSVENFR